MDRRSFMKTMGLIGAMTALGVSLSKEPSAKIRATLGRIVVDGSGSTAQLVGGTGSMPCCIC